MGVAARTHLKPSADDRIRRPTDTDDDGVSGREECRRKSGQRKHRLHQALNKEDDDDDDTTAEVQISPNRMASAQALPPSLAAPTAPTQPTAYPPTLHAPAADFKPDAKTFPIPEAHNTARSFFAFADPIVQPISRAISSLSASRQKLGLPNPGTIENLTREATKSTLLTNLFFEGARADLTKALNINPIFQVSHAFTYGAQGVPPSYNFGAVVGDENTFLQGSVDDSGSVMIRANRRLMPGHISKAQAQLAAAGGQSFVQLEHDFQGIDHSVNIKAINPQPTDATGIYTFNFLQSLTRNFALGLETVWMRQSVDMSEATTGYVAKWTSDARDAIATLQLQGSGVAQATYWQRLAEKVEAAVDLQCITAGGRREAQATVGAKWDFRMSTFRAQVDSGGRISSLLESRLGQTFAFTVGGEIDHLKTAGRFGIGLSIESTGDNTMMNPNAPPQTPPSVPA